MVWFLVEVLFAFFVGFLGFFVLFFKLLLCRAGRNGPSIPWQEGMWSCGSCQISSSPKEGAGAFLPPKHTYVQPKCVTIKPLGTYVVLLSVEFQSTVCVRTGGPRLPSALGVGGELCCSQSQGLPRDILPCVIF